MPIEKRPPPELNQPTQKPTRVTAAKEVGMGNPAEKTTVHPNQNPKPVSLCRALVTGCAAGLEM
jgi:hypothetical protein